MTRCYICDWSPDEEQSEYFLCLLTSHFSVSKNFLLDDSKGRPICHECDLASQDNIEEIFDEELPILLEEDDEI